MQRGVTAETNPIPNAKATQLKELNPNQSQAVLTHIEIEDEQQTPLESQKHHMREN